MSEQHESCDNGPNYYELAKAKDARIAQLERELVDAKNAHVQACDVADRATRWAETAEEAVIVLYDNIKMALTAMDRCGLTAMADGIRADIITEPCISVISSALAATVRKEGA